MAKKAACRCKHTECEECPEWIFTFADLVMLMMGFFVILWVLKPNPNPKSSSPPSEYTDLVKAEAAIREAFGYVPKAGSADPVTNYMLLQRAEQIKIPDGPGKGGKTTVKPIGPPGSDADPSSIRPGPQAMVGGRLAFDVADDRLPGMVQQQADAIADIVRGHRNLVMIKGHTSLDDLPESATAAQQMALSIRRAQVVADYLTSKGVAPELIRIQGCSTFEPVAVREYEPGSQNTNRRVEVYTTPQLLNDLQGKPSDGAKKALTQSAATEG